ncbi:DUF3861 domain-containing protein [Pelistega europaea]|uniref:DUF3861 domain-containing protein n=1 Tax=Pelistega europaea TaxID=106147 RepID=A0A7Y4L7T4_9BURK|nr:DUF3861 domain-containing protein [Pelistega europaea]NOL48560.1 DUF3861 domain-containing protein [Pelistega europaea]
MKKHQYAVTVDYIADAEGNEVNQTLRFNAPNHDNIFRIIELTQQREGFTPEMAQRFAVGLKLMSEVMLENKDNPLFQQLRPFMMEMMKVIKGKN